MRDGNVFLRINKKGLCARKRINAKKSWQ